MSVEEGRLFARNLGLSAFSECSALTQKNLKTVFDTAIMVSLEHKEELKSMRQSQRLRQSLALRQKTPEKIRQFSQTWWRKFSCFM